MKIHFLGADKEVTGSRHMIEVNGKRILLDCGLYQGHRKDEYKKNKHFPFDPKSVDVLLLSHAHIDHSGNIPNLCASGFEGPVMCTYATLDLCHYMLRDSAYIQEKEIEYLNKKRRKRKEKFDDDEMLEPVYTLEDTERALEQFQSVSYRRWFYVTEGVKAIFYDAGHILGAAIILLDIEDKEAGKHHTLCYTGDLGRKGLPILGDPEMVPEADYIITESTYGNRYHESIYDAAEKLANVVNNVADRGGKIIVPAFSLGRTQEMVYQLHVLTENKKIPNIPIYVDSPLAGNVTEVFRNHPECYDDKTKQVFLEQHKNPFGFDRLRYTKSVEESKALNNKPGPMIIISASGMCEHGRVLHHLRNNIEDPRNMVLVVGYMAENTLGRKILEKQKIVKIFGKPYKMRCDVTVIDAYSAHADRADLIDYLTRLKGLKKAYLVHGEEEALNKLDEALKENGINDVTIPNFGDIVEF